MDIYDIKTYFKYDNQKKAIMQAMRNGINKKKFFEMKKNAGFTNWTFEKRKYKKELIKLKEDQEEDNNIIFQEKDYNNEDIEIPNIIWSNSNQKKIEKLNYNKFIIYYFLKMILPNAIKYKDILTLTTETHSLANDIKNYLLKIFTNLSEEEKKHFNELYSKYPQNNTFERILYIIVIVEENRVNQNQEIGEFAKGLIDLSPPDIQELYIKFVKEERIVNLNAKLCKTFENFEKEICTKLFERKTL